MHLGKALHQALSFTVEGVPGTFFHEGGNWQVYEKDMEASGYIIGPFKDFPWGPGVKLSKDMAIRIVEAHNEWRANASTKQLMLSERVHILNKGTMELIKAKRRVKQLEDAMKDIRDDIRGLLSK